ncbi:hypothetical protein BOQ62_19140 [Chryseobacterium sp. CH21]|uniref:hypothetical protein n=1 Tax=Chryseobacterium sp. CH21 TaxID=713556 RepID=UPI00100AC443|nr:hypothetical protein [Chryseobacterium sp. CH21]RXM38046.1 hypothetical protein BOQ62_19140 [Chryseobacterium sp. CH21]
MVTQKTVIGFLIYLSFFSMFSCQSAELEHVRSKLLKKIQGFETANFPLLYFDRLYILEGTYITKGKFNIVPPKLEMHRGSDLKKHEDYIIFNSNGTVEKLYAENEKTAEQLLGKDTSGSNAVLYMKGGRFFIDAIQAFKMGGGFGTYRQEIKFENNKLFIQNGANCSVYLPVVKP